MKTRSLPCQQVCSYTPRPTIEKKNTEGRVANSQVSCREKKGVKKGKAIPKVIAPHSNTKTKENYKALFFNMQTEETPKPDETMKISAMLYFKLIVSN